MESASQSRKIYLDILRIIACFLVLLCHTINFTYNSSIIDNNWIPSNILYYISKVAVPIFFMISGALMLRRDITYKEIFKKITFRLLIPLFIVSVVIYFKRTPIFNIQNIFEFFKEFLNAEILLPLWFIYGLIGMYICTPFLRKMVKNMEKKDYIFLFVIWIIVTGILPILTYYTGIKVTSNLLIPIIGRYIPYYVLGYYMFEKDKIKTTNKGAIIISILGIISLAVSVFLTYLDVKYKQTTTMFLDKVDYINLIIPTFAVAYVIKHLFDKKNFSKNIQKIIVSISGTTFGIYLLHGVLIGHLEFIYKFLSQYVGSSMRYNFA